MMDADMMEEETATPPTPTPEMTLNSDQGGDAVRDLLALARQLIDQGKPSQALQSVVMAMKTKGGDEAVFQAMNRARELYINKLQASAAADELASLFAECAIAEALPFRTVQSEQYTVGLSIEPDAHGTSILAESGRKQIVLDAFSDGSSFVCLQCGGLVSNHRKEEHYAYWCCKI
ncbi:uncharacterized protein LOC130776105 [Actinidia eriantha]|uniref:uncharacterized protein LOC130776105 n=1 Tax=Actinidia eriantha TaxID=165200 RepID=UPI002589E7CF|nr:uncharacterized protein LOC130776105 [Actinidia eriantha]